MENCDSIYSPIEHDALAIWLRRDLQNHWMGMLTYYFDGSGDAVSERVYSVAGYVSTADRWIYFDKKWNAYLRHNGIQYFHMKEFAPSVDQFKDWKGKDHKRAAFLAHLVRMIRECALYSFSVTMGMHIYNRANKEFELEERGIVPLLLCGGTCVQKALNWMDRSGRVDGVKFYFEKGEPCWGIMKKWMDARGLPCEDAPKIPELDKPLMCPLGPLQAADFVAWEHRKLYDDSVLAGIDRFRKSLEGLTSICHDWGAIECNDMERVIRENNIPHRNRR